MFLLVDVNINIPPIQFNEKDEDEAPIGFWSIILFIFCFFVCGLILYLCRRYPSKFPCKIPAFLAIVLLLAIFTECANSASPRYGYGKKRSKFSKVAKPAAKWTIAGTIPALAYLAIESIIEWINDPDNSWAVAFLAFSLIFLIIFIFLIIYLCYQFNRQKISPSNSPIANPPIELTELQTAVQELINRTNPRPNLSH